MPRINLLPWREQQRTERKKAFGVGVVGALIGAAVVYGAGLLMMNAINRKADPEDKKLFGGLRDMAKMWLGVSDIVEEVSRAQSGSGAVAKDENWLLESMGDR